MPGPRFRAQEPRLYFHPSSRGLIWCAIVERLRPTGPAMLQAKDKNLQPQMRFIVTLFRLERRLRSVVSRMIKLNALFEPSPRLG